MRIVHVKQGYGTFNKASGVDRALRELIRAQREAGHQVRVIDPSGLPQVRPRKPSVEALRLGWRRGAFEIIESASDIVHAHGAFWLGNDLLLRSLRGRVPYVITPHGSYRPAALSRRPLLKCAYKRLVGVSRIIASAGAIIALSESEREDIVSVIGGWPPVDVVPNILPDQHLVSAEERCDARRVLGWSDETVGLVYVGRLDIEHKGLDILLAAFQLAATDGRDRGLVIAGPFTGADHPLARFPGARARGVRLMNEVYGSEKRALLAAADCFVQPSRADAMPLGPLEALGMGIPVAVSSLTGLSELLEATPAAGSVVAVSPSAVQRLIEQLDPHDDAVRRAVISASAARRFSGESVVNRMTATYASAMQSAFG